MKLPIDQKAFSLVELIIVIAIISILLSIVSLNFFDWQRKSQIERQVRELYTDLNTLRMDSVYKKNIHRITFQPNSYIMKRYSSQNESYTAGTIIGTKNLAYQLTRETGGDISDYSLEFNIRGMTTGANFSSSNLTIRVNPFDTSALTDCLIIHFARTNMGKMKNDGSACEFK